MKDGSRINKVLEKMTLFELKENLEYLEIAFGDVTRISKNTGKNLAQELVSRKYDETKLSMALRTLFRQAELDVNHKDKNGLNFVQIAIKTGYSQKFICDCIRQTLALNIDVNHKDNKGNTMLHTAVGANNFKDPFVDILKLVDVYGFDSHTKNSEGKEFSDLLFESTKYDQNTKMKCIKEMYDIVARPKNLIIHHPRPKMAPKKQ